MVIRTLAVLMFGVLFASGLSAQQNEIAAKPGSQVFVTMTGELAKEYAKRTGLYADEKFPPGLRIQVVAMIEQILEDGQLRIEHFANEGPRELVQSGGLEPESYRLTG